MVLSHRTIRFLVLAFGKQDFRPCRIILLRHGQSQGNVDDAAYVNTPDWRIPLTEKGQQQASEAGLKLAGMIEPDGQVFVYYSPYERSKETVKELCRHLDRSKIIASREDPRISEQQVG